MKEAITEHRTTNPPDWLAGQHTHTVHFRNIAPKTGQLEMIRFVRQTRVSGRARTPLHALLHAVETLHRGTRFVVLIDLTFVQCSVSANVRCW